MIWLRDIEEESIEEIRKDLLHDIYLALIFTGFATMLATLFRNRAHHLELQSPYIGILLSCISVLFIVRRRIPTWLLATVPLAAQQFAGGFYLSMLGPTALGAWHLANSVVLAWILIRRRGAYIVTGTAFAIFLGSWASHQVRVIPDFSTTPAAWINLYAFLLMQGLIVFVATRRLFGIFQKRHEEANEAHRLRACMLESLQESVLVIDPSPGREGRILEANRGAESLFQAPRSVLIGSLFQELFPSGAPVLVLSEGLRTMEAVRSDSTRIWVEIATSRHWVGKRERILVSIRDIGDRMLRRDQLFRLNTELEQRVRARTIQLERAHEEIRAFSYAVSHDLRAPLRAVNGFATALREDCASVMTSDDLTHLETILDRTENIQQEIDALLELSRLERLGVKLDRIDLGSLVPAICEEVADISPRFVWASRARLSGEWPSIESDTPTIRALWMNLVHDAIKAHPVRERPLISIVAERSGEEGTNFTISPIVENETLEARPSQAALHSRGTLQHLVHKLGGELHQREMGPGRISFLLKLPDALKV